jgi:hypothetical protein
MINVKLSCLSKQGFNEFLTSSLLCNDRADYGITNLVSKVPVIRQEIKPSSMTILSAK